jgi:hypothetical protein
MNQLLAIIAFPIPAIHAFIALLIRRDTTTLAIIAVEEVLHIVVANLSLVTCCMY